MRQRSKEQLDYIMMLNNTGHLTVVFLDQPSVQKKIQKFHMDLASLEAPQPCTPCQEAIPEISPTI